MTIIAGTTCTPPMLMLPRAQLNIFDSRKFERVQLIASRKSHGETGTEMNKNRMGRSIKQVSFMWKEKRVSFKLVHQTLL